jgi:predicted NAD/FAD-binding protein
MQEIKQFLEHLESDRVITQFADHAGLINVRTDENKQEIKENALLSFEDLTSSIQKNLSTREDIKLVQRDEKSI